MVDDNVVLKGLIKGGTYGLAVFTFPEHLRPQEPLHLLTATGSTNFTQVGIGLLRILPDGNVVPLIGSTGWFALDQVRFLPG